MEDRSAATRPHGTATGRASTTSLRPGGAADHERLLEERRSAWSARRGGAGLAAAIWQPDMGAFRVAVRSSAAVRLDSMGFMSGGEHYLHLEEAAFLADRGNLLLFEDATGRPGSVGKRLLSLEEVLHAMAAFGVPLERYLLYSGLARLGFIVRR